MFVLNFEEIALKRDSFLETSDKHEAIHRVLILVSSSDSEKLLPYGVSQLLNDCAGYFQPVDCVKDNKKFVPT